MSMDVHKLPRRNRKQARGMEGLGNEKREDQVFVDAHQRKRKRKKQKKLETFFSGGGARSANDGGSNKKKSTAELDAEMDQYFLKNAPPKVAAAHLDQDLELWRAKKEAEAKAAKEAAAAAAAAAAATAALPAATEAADAAPTEAAA